MKDNLTEEKAFILEKEHIKYWKDRNQAKTNLHEGGFGGDVFKYYPQGKLKMIEKCREKLLGKNNQMYKKNWKDFSTIEKIEKHKINCSKVRKLDILKWKKELKLEKLLENIGINQELKKNTIKIIVEDGINMIQMEIILERSRMKARS